MKAQIVKCPCGYCGQWELRRPNGTLFRRYGSQVLAMQGMAGMYASMKEMYVLGVHSVRGEKI